MARRKVSFIITARNKGFIKAMEQSQRRLSRFGRKMERMGQTMTRNISVPVALAGGAAVKMAADFESSFADVRKTVDATEEEFQRLQKELRNLSKEVPTSIEELNRLAGVAGQLDVGTDNLVEFTKTIAMLGDTTDISGEQAALALARFMNVMGTAEQDIDRVGSAIVGLGNNFAAMESEIIEIATSMAPLGNSIGLTEQQVLAFSATIAASGGELQAAGTAFQKTANTMKQAVIEGTAELDIFAETAGVTASEFQRAFQEDAGRALQMFLEGLRRMQESGKSVATVLENVGLGDQRLIREFGKVIGNLDDLDRGIVQANTDWERNTALTEEAQKRYSTFASQMKILGNRAKDLAITVGNDLIPFVRVLIGQAEQAIKWFEGLSKETRGWGIAVAAAAALAGPILIILGKMTIALAALMSPVLLAKAAIVGLFVGVVTTGQWLVDNWDKISQGFENAMLTMEATAQKMALGVIKSIKSIFNFVTSFVPAEWMTAIFGIDLSEIALDFAGINGLIKDLEGNVSDTTDKLEKGIKKFNEQAWGEFSDSAKKALELTKQALINGLQGILNSQQIQDLIAKVENAFQVSAPNVPGSGSTSGGRRDNNPIGTKGLPFSLPEGQLKRAESQFNSIREAMGGVTEEAKIMGDALQTTVTNAVASFAETLGNAFTGDAGASGFFKNILLIVVDFANNFGKMLVAAGVAAQAFKSLLANPIAAIAAGGALIALTTAIRNLLERGPEQSVSDAIIRSDGSIVRLHPNDDILAMQDFGNLQPAMSGSQVIRNELFLDGRTVWSNQRRVNTNKRR